MTWGRRFKSIEERLRSLEVSVGRLALRMTSSPIALAYPEPVATPLAHQTGAGLHGERFFSLIDAGEACIRYTGAIAVSLSLASGREVDLQQLLRRPLSLGRWVEQIRGIVLEGNLPETLVAEAVKSSLFRANGTLSSAGRFLLDEFVALRNRERGHGASLPDEAYERLNLRHSSELLDALGECRYLALPLVLVESVNVAIEPFVYDIRMLVGPPPLTSTERVQAVTRVPVGSACVWDNSETLLTLGSLVIYRSCPVCNLQHTFFLERIAGRIKHYHAYFGNHRFTE